MKRAWYGCFVLVMACVPDERPQGSKATTAVPPHPSAPGLPGARDLGRPIDKPLGSAEAPAVSPGADLPLPREFVDHFDRAAVGPDWALTTPAWHIENGRLCAAHAKNHPAWLRRRLPVNARVEFDASSASQEGDIKAEFWGDGRSAAETVSYNAATSYLTIFGGWKNQFHVLARIDEHAPNRPERRIDSTNDDLRARRVEAGRTYRFKVVRDDGRTVHWYVDDLEILSYPDPEPLTGAGHDHFGFNDWDVPLCFDNLVVSALP